MSTQLPNSIFASTAVEPTAGSHVLSVILAGGSGTRFWPMSRVKLPKQVLNISGNDAMINETLHRCEPLIPLKRQFIVTARSQREPLEQIISSGFPKENILAEPCQRNTAPCILYAALKLKALYGDGVMCVFPSDQYITDSEEFNRVLTRAIGLAEGSESLITLGIRPTFPSTGYGYIHYDALQDKGGAYPVSEFVEKPVYDKAAAYVQSGNYLWNSGIFVWKISTILENFNRYLPRLYDKMSEWYDTIGTCEEDDTLEAIYPQLQKISIDFGILERSNQVLVVPADMGWNDVGSWDALGAIFPPDASGNILRAKDSVLLDTTDCIIYSEKQLVSATGLHNMIVVSTDDALLVLPKNQAQDVKHIVEELQARGMTQYL